MSFNALFKILLTCILLSFIGGCTSTKAIDSVNVNSYDEITKYLRVGDHVSIVTIDDHTHEFIIRDIDSSTISGNSNEVEIVNIKKIDKEEVEVMKTIGLTIVTAIGALAFALFI